MSSVLGSSDVAVIGGGIVGLACALEARRRGRSVVVFERSPRAVGASIRNFGMVWPVGQLPGRGLDMALRSRERWLELSTAAGFQADSVGSIHAAHHEDELAVLEEFCQLSQGHAYRVRMLTAEQAVERSPWLRREGLRGAMFSETEVQVDPRQAIARLTAHASEGLGIRIQHASPVAAVNAPEIVLASGDRWRADRVCVCTGEDLRTLYPEVYASSGLKLTKLQMMRTGPQSRQGDVLRMGPMLAFGATIRHYRSFERCPSVGKVRARFAAERPLFDQFGIHVMASQTPAGEITIGDSHEYGEPVTPFTRGDIDESIMNYLTERVRLPDPAVRERWFGVYSKAADGALGFVASPNPAVRIVNGLGGAGMTLSFGLAGEVFDAWE